VIDGDDKMRFEDCARGTTTLADGAWGTELQKLGAGLGACSDEWNLTKPELVRQVAESYVQAGSRIILTNTFRANSIALSGYGLQPQIAAINRAGVKISRAAAGKCAMVFASVGPSGKLLLTKEVTTQQLSETFAEQARALAEEGPDALLIETMTDLAEARIAAAAALETGLPVIVSMVFDSGKNRDRTMMGVTPEQAATALKSEGVQGIGANCGLGIREFIPVCKRLAEATSLPIWIKPNAGLPEMVGGVAKYKTTPEEFATSAAELVAAGATFLGGCCGTSPEFIRELARVTAKTQA
jgi:5-methyltetrahydrofolate--homocysteine methyltransferase